MKLNEKYKQYDGRWDIRDKGGNKREKIIIYFLNEQIGSFDTVKDCAKFNSFISISGPESQLVHIK